MTPLLVLLAFIATFFQQSKACPEFLRHKTQIASPTFLESNGIPVHRCVQHEGEFMITFPFGYHSGYNLGFNCAESVNFALSSWIDIGRQAKPCKCITDSVTIDMDIFDPISSTIHDTNTVPSPSPRTKAVSTTNPIKKLKKTPTTFSIRLMQDTVSGDRIKGAPTHLGPCYCSHASFVLVSIRQISKRRKAGWLTDFVLNRYLKRISINYTMGNGL